MENENSPVDDYNYGYEIRICTKDIVVALVAQGLPVERVASAVTAVYDAFAGLGRPQIETAAASQVERPSAAKIRSSVTPDTITSFEDGKRYKSLKRHLTARGLTPMEYRTKWGLPVDYPMVAPAYAAVRSELAKASGLGRKAGSETPGIVVGLNLSGSAEDVAARYPDPAPDEAGAAFVTKRRRGVSAGPGGEPTADAPASKKQRTRKAEMTAEIPAAESVTGDTVAEGFGDAPVGQTAEQILAS